MEDNQIVALYWKRDEEAIRATDQKYGPFCHAIAYNILASHEDAEETVNDTYAGAWNAMPPHRPGVLSSFLAKLTRRISLNRWRDNRAGKRGGGQVPLALDELTECIPAGQDVAQEVELKELAAAVRRFLSGLAENERDVFVSRYFYLAPIAEISQKFGFSESKTKSMLFRIRGKLRKKLQEEGFL